MNRIAPAILILAGSIQLSAALVGAAVTVLNPLLPALAVCGLATAVVGLIDYFSGKNA